MCSIYVTVQAKHEWVYVEMCGKFDLIKVTKYLLLVSDTSFNN